MNRKIVAVDIDEVLIPHNAPLADLHNRLFGTSHTVDDYHDDWPLLWSVNREEAERRAEIWWNSEEWKQRHERPIDGSLAVLQDLQKKYDLVIVTGRSKRTAEFTEKWLEEYFPSIFSNVHFVGIWEEGLGKNKSEVCLNTGVSYLIEDSLEQAFACAEKGIEVLLFGDYNWNKHDSLGQKVVRVKDWQEVGRYFEKDYSN
ncbi:hypothetical protein KDA00_00540 [Candidatus Saccharibacteria bacterium]|nr:hypothetical protein [Candidatus Saccharibacteria bacterium]